MKTKLCSMTEKYMSFSLKLYEKHKTFNETLLVNYLKKKNYKNVKKILIWNGLIFSGRQKVFLTFVVIISFFVNTRKNEKQKVDKQPVRKRPQFSTLNPDNFEKLLIERIFSSIKYFKKQTITLIFKTLSSLQILC